jgi:hypothetical protein
LPKEKKKKKLFQCTLVPNTFEGKAMQRVGIRNEQFDHKYAYTPKQAQFLFLRANPGMEITQIQLVK